MVPIKDYANISGASFRVLVDTAQLHQRLPLLDIRLDQVPEHVHVLKTEPKQVEYLIVNSEDRSQKDEDRNHGKYWLGEELRVFLI